MTVSVAPSDEMVRRMERSASGRQWKRIGVRHHHGFNVPIFSLRTEHSAGIGEFTDLIPLIRWMAQLGMDILQLLPLNDTGQDSSPYNALSAFAINPLHLGLHELLEDDSHLKDCFQALQDLNQSQRIDYPKVRSLRDAFLYRYFQLRFSSICGSSEYQDFLRKNSWLTAYAVFKTLKEQRPDQSWMDWPAEERDPTPESITALAKKHKERVDYHCFVQFLCQRQLSRVREIAEEHKVFLKGDIPILLSRESADYWEHRELFHHGCVAGAPPDMYNSDGQNWGFPVYNWEAIEEDNFRWWRQRLKVAEQYYHLYRLDHIVGFFRIWTIPPGASAVDGSFLPEDESLWLPLGRKILLMMLEASSMLPIGEDLGTIPQEARDCMRTLNICGTKVMRWERDWEKETQPFIRSKDYIQESLTTVSTHDSETLMLWWKQCPEESKAYADFRGWSFDAELTRERLQMILRESHHSGSLFHINLLNEYLHLVPSMVWPQLEDERINTPGTISDQNWSYRFRPSVEEIISSDVLAAELHHVLDR